MQAQPLIAVKNIPASSHWYQVVLGCESGHGGAEYEQIVSGGKMILQLHLWEAHEHPHLGNPDIGSRGNGIVLWFQTDEFDQAISRIRTHGVEVLEEPKINPNAGHREVWLRDPDGYVVVVAGRYGDLGAEQA
jgi:catechol 2,3-dioxygenase-like lactoylglutathione lyase family enzyme